MLTSDTSGFSAALRGGCAAIALFAFAGSAAAADGSAETASQLAQTRPILEEIRVTAERREEALPAVVGGKIFSGKKASLIAVDRPPPPSGAALRQSLAQIPGLLISEVANTSWASLSYRGLGEPHESWNLLILEDGIPLSPDPYNYPAAYYTPAMESIDRVVFVRGGASLLYGPQPGGVLEYVSREPRAENGIGFSGRALFGSDRLRSFYGAVDARQGDLGVIAYGAHSQGEGAQRTNADFEQSSGRLKITGGGDGDTRWRATLSGYRGRMGEPGGLTVARLNADRRDGSQLFDRVYLDRFAGSVGLVQEFDRTSIEARAWTSYFSRKSMRQPGGGFGTPKPANGVSNVQTQYFWQFGGDLRARHDAEIANTPVIFTGGAMVLRTKSPVRVNKGVSPTDDEGLAGALSRTERFSTVGALFSEALVDFGALKLTPGVRLERINQNVREQLDLSFGSNTGGGPGGPNGVLQAKDESQWVPLFGLGATYDVNDANQLYANISRGFKPLLFNDGVTFQSGVSVAETFDASYTLTMEAGWRAALGPALSSDISVFRVRFDDQVGFLGGPLAAAPGFGAVADGGARRQNIGKMVNQGVEALVTLDVLEAFAAANDAARLNAFFGVQGLDAALKTGPAAGNRPQYAPKWMLRGGLNYAYTETLDLSLTVTHVGAHNGSDNAAAAFAIPAYTVVDLSAEVALGASGVSIVGGISNLFDEKYWARIRPGGGQGIDPGSPRSFYLGLSAKY